MEFSISTLIAQAINFVLLLLLFKRLLGDKISKSIEKRRELMRKVSQADQEYDQIIAQAEQEKKSIIDQALKHKQTVFSEAETLANKKSARIVSDAEKQGQQIIQDALERSEKLEKELQQNYLQGVKHTTKLVVKKLIDEKPELKDAYLEQLADEFISS
jgi:F0F1-type ATP synthase membrane subunit b/b'